MGNKRHRSVWIDDEDWEKVALKAKELGIGS